MIRHQHHTHTCTRMLTLTCFLMYRSAANEPISSTRRLSSCLTSTSPKAANKRRCWHLRANTLSVSTRPRFFFLCNEHIRCKYKFVRVQVTCASITYAYVRACKVTYVRACKVTYTEPVNEAKKDYCCYYLMRRALCLNMWVYALRVFGV